MIALRALEICSLVALDRPDALRAKLDALGDLLESDRHELTADWTWTFAGSRHFIERHPELSRHSWRLCCIDRARTESGSLHSRDQAARSKSLLTKRTSPVTPSSNRMHWRLRIIRITSKPLMVA